MKNRKDVGLASFLFLSWSLRELFVTEYDLRYRLLTGGAIRIAQITDSHSFAFALDRDEGGEGGRLSGENYTKMQAYWDVRQQCGAWPDVRLKENTTLLNSHIDTIKTRQLGGGKDPFRICWKIKKWKASLRGTGSNDAGTRQSACCKVFDNCAAPLSDYNLISCPSCVREEVSGAKGNRMCYPSHTVCHY